MLVQSLVTAVLSNGLNLQILGFFGATVDGYHGSLGQDPPKVGQRIKTRVLYNIPGTSPPQYAVTLRDHHLALRIKSPTDNADESSIIDAFPLGTTLDSVTVQRVEAERGLLMEVQPSLEGFVHVGHHNFHPHLFNKSIFRFLKYRMTICLPSQQIPVPGKSPLATRRVWLATTCSMVSSTFPYGH